ncbi:hypothetical protein Hanom_Chr04g00289641 [Helianthus anomalus]
MFVPLTKQTKFLVHIRPFSERTNTNELPAKQFVNCSLNVRTSCCINIHIFWSNDNRKLK